MSGSDTKTANDTDKLSPAGQLHRWNSAGVPRAVSMPATNKVCWRASLGVKGIGVRRSVLIQPWHWQWRPRTAQEKWHSRFLFFEEMGFRLRSRSFESKASLNYLGSFMTFFF